VPHGEPIDNVPIGPSATDKTKACFPAEGDQTTFFSRASERLGRRCVDWAEVCDA
jgi:hypothetical protein